MPLPPDEPACAKFQPNIFDPSRCHDCLRQKRVHGGAGLHAEGVAPDAGRENATGIGTGTGTRAETRTVTGEEEPAPRVGDKSGRKEAGPEEEADRLRLKVDLGQDDSDSQSAVSIYCDVNEGCHGYQRSSLCALSPDCGLYTCDADNDSSSTYSCPDRSDSPELNTSNTDDEDFFRSRPAMTRLDRPAHRPDPRDWMEEARGRDAFSKTPAACGLLPGFRGERESRDSGYFSLGRAAGSRSLRGQSPPAPFRHFERGHPVFNTRYIEPKDTVPFRNRHVAAPPDRPSLEDQDKNQIAQPPDPYEIAVEVEAQVGPRSPSPTPFKIAESLASTSQRRQGSSYGKGNLSSHLSSPNQQSGRHDSKLCSTLQSRSSSPSRGRSPFQCGEGSLSLNTRSFDGGGPERRSRSPSQASPGRGTGSGTLPRNFKSFAGSVKSQDTTVSDFKSVLRKSEADGVFSSRGKEGRSVSPLRKDYSTSGLASLRKTEPLRSVSNGQRQLGNSCSSSPSRQDRGGLRAVESSPLTRKSYTSSSQSLIRKSESVTSLSSRGHQGRCGSPIREGYDIESQALLRNPDAWNTQNNLERDNSSPQSTRRNNNTTVNNLMSHKSLNCYGGGRVNESRSSSPGRKSYESPGRYQPKNADTRNSFNDSGRTSPRRTYDIPAKSLRSESGGLARGRDGRSPSPPRRSHDSPGAYSLRKAESVTSLNRLSSSPSRTTNADSPGYSILRKVTTAESSSHCQRKTTQGPAVSERSGSSRSLRDSTYSLHSSSVSRSGSPSRTASSPGHRETCKTASFQAPRESSRTTSFQAPRETSRTTSFQSPRETSRTTSFQAQRETSRTTSFQAPRETSRTTSFQAQRETSRTTSFQAPRETSRTTSFQAPRETSRTTSFQAPRENNRTSFQAPRETSRTTSFQAPRETNRTTSFQAPRETSKTTSFQAPRETSRATGYQTPRETSRPTSVHATRETSRTTNFQAPRETSRITSFQASSQTVGSQGPRETSRSTGFQVAREASRPGFQGPRETSRTASPVSRQASRSSSINRFSGSRRGLEEQGPSPGTHRPSRHTQSPSPPPLIQLQSNTSSQSSMDSWESGERSWEESGSRSREEYAVLADVPRVRMMHQREEAVKPQHHQGAPGRQELFKPASHSVSRHPSRERDHPGSPNRELLGRGNLSRSHSSNSLFRQGCGPTGEEGTGDTHTPEPTQPDLLNFKKGWMSKMDDVGEWKKHWFVLTDAGLKYYRDSGAEEKDEPDGEIDLVSCLRVSEFEVEKNYGFQIQTREGMVTLSAMTAGIRRNWIEVLRKSVQPSSSPDLTQLPDSSSDKENSHGAPLLSARRASTRPNPSSPSQRRFNHVELSPLPVPAHSLPASQREAGEGQGREHSQWQEGRNPDTSSQWEILLSRKGPAGSDSWQRMEEEIENKWEEFERLPLKEMKAMPISSQPSGQPANEALHREVASLRQQLETLSGGGGGGGVGEGGGRGEGVGGGAGKACGPDAACRSSLAALERAHRHALQEVQRQHERQCREAQEEQERLLLEETRATAQAMEALKKAHKEQLEREVERATRLCGGTGDSVGLRNQLQADTQALQRELSGLSDRYSHKCLELNRAQQDAAERERELSRRERDLDLLRKENQDLKARLVEAVGRSRSMGTGQGSGGVSNDNRTTTSCELEVLVQVKEKEVEYLHQEIGCLRNELQALNAEKRLSSERRRELEAELSGMRGRSFREVQSLKEHLRLALAALQEGQVLGNSLEH